MALWTSCRFCPSYPATFQISADATGSIVQVQYDISPSPPSTTPKKNIPPPPKKKSPHPMTHRQVGLLVGLDSNCHTKSHMHGFTVGTRQNWLSSAALTDPLLEVKPWPEQLDRVVRNGREMVRETWWGGVASQEQGHGGKSGQPCNPPPWTMMQPPTPDNPPPRTTMQPPTLDNHATPHPGQPWNPHPGQPWNPPPQTTMQPPPGQPCNPPPWTTMQPPPPQTTMQPPTLDNHATPHPRQPCNPPPWTTMQPPTLDNHATPHPRQPCNPPTPDNHATTHPGQPCNPPHPRQPCNHPPWTTMQPPTPDNHATPHPGQPCNPPPQTTMQPPPGQPCNPPPWTTMQPPHPRQPCNPPTLDNHATPTLDNRTPHPGQPCNHSTRLCTTYLNGYDNLGWTAQMLVFGTHFDKALLSVIMTLKETDWQI